MNEPPSSENPFSENPFSEPGDPDRTIIRPVPGGTRAATRPNPAPPPPPPDGPDIETVAAGDGPLAIAAAPLLHLLARLRNTATAPDPGDIRDRTRLALRAFERRARDAGLPADQIRLAHYALCAALDDVVLNTPWGGQGRWHDEPLAQALHKDPDAGAGFFDQIRALRQTLPGSAPVLKLMAVCLSLGMMGPYRTAPDGPATLDRVRHQVFGLITRPGPAALSPDAPPGHRPATGRTRVPVWVALAAALAVIGGAYAWVLVSLNAASDDLYRAALAAPPSTMPALVRPPATPNPPAPKPVSGTADRLRAALAGIPGVELVTSPAATTLRLPAASLFKDNGATLATNPVLDRVANAIGLEPGPVRILAYTDNQPTRTVAFPSRFALSTARAQSVRAVLARQIPDPARITAEGRAEAEPLVPNATPESRARNNRIEIVLRP